MAAFAVFSLHLSKKKTIKHLLASSTVFGKMCIPVLLPSCNWIVFLLFIVGVLYIFEIVDFYLVYNLQIFFSFYGLSFHFLDGILWSVDILNFDEFVNLFFFVVVVNALRVIFKEWMLNPKSWRFILVFFPRVL